MAVILRVDSSGDPRISAYRNLRDRTLARRHDLFIGEGSHIVHRVLASPLEVESLLIAEHRLSEFIDEIPARTPVYVAPVSLFTDIVGFKFHQGALLCARRPPVPSLAAVAGGGTVIVVPQVNNPDNLGNLVRTAAALGATGLVMSRDFGCDPFSRRAIRVSMGAVFKLPIALSDDLQGDLCRLRDEFGYRVVGTVLDPAAVPLAAAAPHPRVALLIGNEPDGLAPEWLAACDTTVTIPMVDGIDSLNVAVAAGIVLHHLRARASGPEPS